VGVRLIVEALDWAPESLTHRERLVLVVLCEDARDGALGEIDDKGHEKRVTWSKVDSPDVLRRCHVSRAELYAVLKSLIRKGCIEVAVRGQPGRRARYRIRRLVPLAGLGCVGDSQTQCVGDSQTQCVGKSQTQCVGDSQTPSPQPPTAPQLDPSGLEVFAVDTCTPVGPEPGLADKDKILAEFTAGRLVRARSDVASLRPCSVDVGDLCKRCGQADHATPECPTW
jgi:hypothetical protein